MLPVFGDERRKKEINLGGASSAATHAAVLDQAKTRRLERQDVRRRQESAIKIQAWWRGVKTMRLSRGHMREIFDSNMTHLSGLRCLVLIGRDEERLGRWSSMIVSAGEEAFLRQFTGPNQASWVVLIRQVLLLQLQSVAKSPQSLYAVNHLQVLNWVLSPSTMVRSLESRGTSICQEITSYLLNGRHHLYEDLSEAIRRIPLESKASPSLPLIVPLLTFPLQTFPDSTSINYRQTVECLITYILTIPVLPNRLPLASLTHLSARLPLSRLSILSPTMHVIHLAIDMEEKVNLIANLIAFVPPRYAKLPADALETYLDLLSTLMNFLPPNSLEPPLRTSSAVKQVADQKSSYPDADASDSESESATRVVVVGSFTPTAPPLPQLDSRTSSRLQTLPSVTHLNALLAASQHHPAAMRQSLFSFFQSLCTIWPTRKNRILGAVVAFTGGGLIRELYRGYVRSSPLGRDDDPKSLMDPSHSSSWPPLVFLIDLYTQLLLTMGDDEFFSITSSANAPRNPLSLDELTSLSRRLLNIAFTLYWFQDQTNVQEGGVPGLSMKWEGVREKVTRCLQAIHARDSRKPFTPPGHWLYTSQIDMLSFVEAAVFEEQQLKETSVVSSRNMPLSKRQVSYLSPRLGVLNNIPFAIPFEVRVSIFRHFIVNDMMVRGVADRYDHSGKTRVTVRRDKISQDGFDRLQDADLHSPIEITFIDRFGQEEAGIDGGGVFKEFFTSLSKEVFDENRGLWLATKQNELYPNPHSYATESSSLSWYRFIGRILGKALYEGILVDVAFAGFFLAKWLGKQSFLDDLASLDMELYNGLMFLKHYPGNPEELSLNFTIGQDEFGVTNTIDLLPNGGNTAVTRENRLQYIYLVSHYRLSKQIKRQSEAFFEGLSDMIDPKWLRMFNQQELQVLVGGVNAPIDLDDLRQNTNYGGLYDDNEVTIQAFWKTVNTFNQDQRRALLRFATSCSRPPLLGFKELVPKFSIRDAGSDENRLPTASTCVNLLKLPRYKSETVLREKILQAIYSGAGFDLS